PAPQPPPPPGRKKRPACRYGAACYRKNPDHLRDFDHSPAPAAAAPAATTVAAPAAPAVPAPPAAPAASTRATRAPPALVSAATVKELEFTDSGSDGGATDVDSDADVIGTKAPVTRPPPALPDSPAKGKGKKRVLPFGGRAATAKAAPPAINDLAAGDDDDDDDDGDGDADYVDPDAASSSSRPKRPRRAPPPAAKDNDTGRAISLLLAHKWESDVDPTGWWMSEKLDGVRAYYEPKSRTFFSRLGNKFFAPAWFVAGFPAGMSLDGELFGGRGRFAQTVSVVKSHDSPNWHRIRFLVFDAPSLGEQPFEKRLETARAHFASVAGVGHVEVVAHTRCKGAEHLREELAKVEKKGGEGLMLRQPKSRYENRRSRTLLKVKNFYDAEAVVIGHERGSGKNSDVMGALRVRMANGTEFKVGSGFTDAQRRRPPKVGAIITYRFQELSARGHPRFPTFVGERIDADKPSDADIRPIQRTKSDVARDQLFDDEDDDADADDGAAAT
ncbi:hypothetical protein HK405_012238, partial [Cladochytrium tenue]